MTARKTGYWTHADSVELLRRHALGEPPHVMAAHFNRTTAAVGDRLRRLGKGVLRQEAWTPEQDATLLAMAGQGVPFSKIAPHVWRSETSCRDRHDRLTGTVREFNRPQLSRLEVMRQNVLHVGACMREAGVEYLDDLAGYYRTRCEVWIEPSAVVKTYIPSSFADGRSCVGSQAAMCEGA